MSTNLQQMAWRLGFLPEHDQLAAECLSETRDTQAMDVSRYAVDGMTEEDVITDMAMGFFAFLRYVDLGHPLPKGTEEWYAANTRKYLGGSRSATAGSAA